MIVDLTNGTAAHKTPLSTVAYNLVRVLMTQFRPAHSVDADHLTFGERLMPVRDHIESCSPPGVDHEFFRRIDTRRQLTATMK